jgi:hypothetical protein
MVHPEPLKAGGINSIKTDRSNGTRSWRNWQTRMAQDHVGAIPWRFKSSRPHSRRKHRDGGPIPRQSWGLVGD